MDLTDYTTHINSHAASTKAVSSRKTKHVIYSFTSEEAFLDFTENREVSYADRVLTYWSMVFPWMRMNNIPGVKILPWTQSSGAHQYTDSQRNAAIQESYAIAAIYGFGLTMKTPKDLKAKVSRRIRALLYDFNSPSLFGMVDTLLAKSRILEVGVEERCNGVLDDAMGRILKVDRYGKFDPLIKNMDRLRPHQHQLPDEIDVSWSNWRLYIEFEMVFKNYKQNQMMLIPTCIQLIREKIGEEFPKVMAEIEAYERYEHHVTDCSYIGCASQIPKEVQVGTYPRLVFMARKFHEKKLSEPLKTQFKEMKTLAINPDIFPPDEQLALSKFVENSVDMTTHHFELFFSRETVEH
jgi:hypothetical protein